jgi:hypothetical protein
MSRYSIAFVFVLLCTAPAASAGPIAFEFRGGGDTELTGGFVLDDGAPWVLTPDGSGVAGQLSSPLQRLWGTFGEFAFEGTASLHLWDQPAFRSDGSDVFTPDHWIIRAPLSGPATGGLTPMWLNLFVYTAAGRMDGLSLTPPEHSGSPYDFQFTLSFANTAGEFESAAGGQLTRLARVPEPGTLTLLALGGVAAFRARARRR